MPINNNSIFGAFTLGEVRSGRLTGDWLNKEAVANYGWFGGGVRGGALSSTIDRINFFNDTVITANRGSLSQSKYNSAATGNSNYGWFGGGTPSLVSTVDRVDFSNDSSTASVRGPLSLAKSALAATGNSNYGWFGGGQTPAVVSTVDRIDFSNDSSTASPRGPLSSVRYGLAATGNSNYGWFGGGSITPASPAGSSIVDRIDFSNDSGTALSRGVLVNTIRYGLAATANSNYGWFGGGVVTSPVSPAGSTVDRINFSNDLQTASSRGTLSRRRGEIAATGNSNYGWFGGGYDLSPGSFPSFPISSIDRIDFSNDTISASVRTISPLPIRYHSATSGVLNIRRQKAGNYGWFGGGQTPVVSTVDRIDFSNDSSTASVRGPLSLAKSALAATGNSNYGWFGGGFPSLSTVDRIDFSNDSSTASVRGPLSSVRQQSAATGNSNYGWFGGGTTSKVDRINFSNDSSTASVRGGPLSSSRYYLAATGNSNYGWFGGGMILFPTTSSRVDRIDFSNDSATASIRGSLSQVRYGLASTGNSNYGWFGGGVTVSTVNRINFSNDSSTASIRGPLSSARGYLAATGNSNYGWFGNGGGTTTVDRINFSNDSVTASIRGSLSIREQLSATSNTNK